MSNQNRPSGSLGSTQTTPSPSVSQSDNVAETVRDGSGANPPQFQDIQSLPLQRIEFAPLQVQRDPVQINYYWLANGTQPVHVSTELDKIGRPTKIYEDEPWSQVYMATVDAYINPDKTASFANATRVNIPFGPGKPGHYDLPGLIHRGPPIPNDQ